MLGAENVSYVFCSLRSFFHLCFSSAGKMLVSLTVDGEFLYWISIAEDSTQIYQAKKSNGAILSQVEAPRSKHILVYSSVLQPFPGRKVTVFMSLFPQVRVREISSCLLLQGSPSSSSPCSQHCSKGQGVGHTAIAVCPGSQFISVCTRGLGWGRPL